MTYSLENRTVAKAVRQQTLRAKARRRQPGDDQA